MELLYIYSYIHTHTRSSSYRAVNTLRLDFESQSMLNREIIARCNDIGAEHCEGRMWNFEMLRPGGSYSNDWASEVKINYKVLIE